MDDKEERIEKKTKKVVLSPELIAAKKRDHELKVAKSEAGGEF